MLLFSKAALAENRFKQYKPNSVLLRGESLGQSDKGKHLEYNFSTKYLIYNSSSHSTFLAYTGRFDFFWSSRDSSPVVNRLNNPEINSRWLTRATDAGQSGIDYLQFAYGHESNGQDIDTQEKYLSDTRLFADDHISRGWDYLAVEAKFRHYWNSERTQGDNNRCANVSNCTEFWFTYKGILSEGLLQKEKEDKRFNTNRKAGGIRDFDGLQFIVSHEWQKSSKRIYAREISLKLTTGANKPFRNNSYELSLRGTTKLVSWKIPLYISYRNGYLEELSDFSQRGQSLAIGLKFRNQ